MSKKKKKKKQKHFQISSKDIIMVDTIYKNIFFEYKDLNFNYDLLIHYFNNNFQFIRNDIGKLFNSAKIREKLRKIQLEEMVIFTYSYVMLC